MGLVKTFVFRISHLSVQLKHPSGTLSWSAFVYAWASQKQAYSRV